MRLVPLDLDRPSLSGLDEGAAGGGAVAACGREIDRVPRRKLFRRLDVRKNFLDRLARASRRGEGGAGAEELQEFPAGRELALLFLGRREELALAQLRDLGRAAQLGEGRPVLGRRGTGRLRYLVRLHVRSPVHM